MSIYRFPDASDVAEVRFRYANDRLPEALIAARPGADAGHLAAVRHALELTGWQCIPAWADGREVLQVTGFKEAGELGGLLLSHRFVRGIPQVTEEPGDHPTRGIRDWLQHTSLRAAGWLNLIGDTGLLVSGLRSGNPDHVSAGALYTAGAAVAALYGNVKTERQVHELLKHTGMFLQQQAVALPEDSGLYDVTHNKRDSALHETQNFLYRYPAEMMLGLYTMGAFTMLQAGLHTRDAQGRRNPWKIAYGGNSVTLKATSLLIPEKHKSEDEKKEARYHTPVGKVISWIEEKPMRLFGFGSFLSDSFLGMAAYRDHQNHPDKKHDIFMWITTGTYLIADALAAISSKDPANADGKFSADEQRRIEAMSAETIARQPESMQAPLINQLASFLSLQPEMRGNADKISRSLTEQLVHIQQNPWAQRVAAAPAQPEQALRT
ncbi:MAG: hypothetical protein WDN72_06735 [Alphaproteobacteria bacterium]